MQRGGAWRPIEGEDPVAGFDAMSPEAVAESLQGSLFRVRAERCYPRRRNTRRYSALRTDRAKAAILVL